MYELYVKIMVWYERQAHKPLSIAVHASAAADDDMKGTTKHRKKQVIDRWVLTFQHYLQRQFATASEVNQWITVLDAACKQQNVKFATNIVNLM